jgi:DNA polymerase-3 subunit delta
LSLFADRRLFELRMPTRKPDKGAQQMVDLAARPPPDTVCVVVTDKLDGKRRRLALGQSHREAWRVGARVAGRDGGVAGMAARSRRSAEIGHGWGGGATHRGARRGKSSGGEAGIGESWRCSADGKRIGAELVLRSVGDSARYDVFQLAEAAAAGDAERALRILLGLKGEGVEPTLILWALMRELRGLWQARERDRLRSNSRGSGWNQAATPSPRALGAHGENAAGASARQAQPHRSGHQGLGGGDAWTRHHRVGRGLAGALQASADSGRVAV